MVSGEGQYMEAAGAALAVKCHTLRGEFHSDFLFKLECIINPDLIEEAG